MRGTKIVGVVAVALAFLAGCGGGGDESACEKVDRAVDAYIGDTSMGRPDFLRSVGARDDADAERILEACDTTAPPRP